MSSFPAGTPRDSSAIDGPPPPGGTSLSDAHVRDGIETEGTDDVLALEAFVPGVTARRIGYAATLLLSSLVAIVATFIIVVERAILTENPDHIASCDLNPWMSCGRVMQSWQAATFGFPNTTIGVVAFSILIGVAMSLFAGARFARWYWLLMNVGILAGLAFAGWLYYAAVFDISTLCLYCMIVWAMVIVQFVLTTSRNIQHGVLPASDAAKARVRDLTWPAIVLIWVLVFASLLLRFGPGMIGL